MKESEYSTPSASSDTANTSGFAPASSSGHDTAPEMEQHQPADSLAVKAAPGKKRSSSQKPAKPKQQESSLTGGPTERVVSGERQAVPPRDSAHAPEKSAQTEEPASEEALSRMNHGDTDESTHPENPMPEATAAGKEISLSSEAVSQGDDSSANPSSAHTYSFFDKGGETDAFAGDETDAFAGDETDTFAYEEKSAFLRSLDELTPEDICPDTPAGQKKQKIDFSDLLRYAVMGVCLCVFSYCAFYLIRQQHYYNASKSESSSIQEEFWGSNKESDVKTATSDGASPASPDYAKSLQMTEDDYRSFLEQINKNPVNEKFEKIKAKLNSIRQKNSDLYGWIRIDGTEINYPIVQSDDNEYYLTHTYTGGYSPAGSVFADYRCSDKITDNYNTILYAHHMTSGSTMFHSLDNYFNETFFRENPYIYIYTLDGIYTFEVFAVYVTDISYPYIQTNFSSDEEFTEFAKDLQAHSLYVREGLTFEKNEHVLTLSTCTNLVKSDRIVVQAKLIQIES